MILKGDNVKLYGNVQVGADVIIEDGVIIGHPDPYELKGCLQHLGEYQTLDHLYASKSQATTIIGNNSIIRSGTVIYSGVTIGNSFDCGHNVLIREKTSIGDFVYLKSNTEIMKNVRVGNHCRIAGVIADNSTIANHVSSFGILTHRYAKHYIPEMSLDPGPTVHDGCIIGRGAVLIGGIHIYERSTIGSNTFINFDVPPDSLVIGTKGFIRTKNGKDA
jgi:UDP-3-O-[3-hydroxymyristoyl] glucosamine N-acyltransferase